MPVPEPPGPDLIPEPAPEPQPPDIRPSPDPQMPPDPGPPERPLSREAAKISQRFSHHHPSNPETLILVQAPNGQTDSLTVLVFGGQYRSVRYRRGGHPRGMTFGFRGRARGAILRLVAEKARFARAFSPLRLDILGVPKARPRTCPHLPTTTGTRACPSARTLATRCWRTPRI